MCTKFLSVIHNTTYVRYLSWLCGTVTQNALKVNQTHESNTHTQQNIREQYTISWSKFAGHVGSVRDDRVTSGRYLTSRATIHFLNFRVATFHFKTELFYCSVAFLLTRWKPLSDFLLLRDIGTRKMWYYFIILFTCYFKIQGSIIRFVYVILGFNF